MGLGDPLETHRPELHRQPPRPTGLGSPRLGRSRSADHRATRRDCDHREDDAVLPTPRRDTPDAVGMRWANKLEGDPCASFTVRTRRSARSAPVLLIGGLTLHVFLEPAEKALEEVLLVAVFSDAVVRVGVDDELGFAAQVFHRLVHLLGVDDRLVPVLLAANE